MVYRLAVLVLAGAGLAGAAAAPAAGAVEALREHTQVRVV